MTTAIKTKVNIKSEEVSSKDKMKQFSVAHETIANAIIKYRDNNA